MVKETRIIFGVSDIPTLSVLCVNCSGEISYAIPSASDFHMRKTCPHCNQPWHRDNRSEPASIERLMRGLVELASPATLGPYSVRMEIDGAED